MTRYGWEDIRSLPDRAKRQILATLEADAARDRTAGRPPDRERGATIAELRRSLPVENGDETSTQRPIRRRERVTRDVGDLYEPSDRCVPSGDGVVLVLVGDPVETVNTSPTHPQAVGAMEKRWTLRALGVITESAIDATIDPAAITFWHLRQRGSGRIADADNRHHAEKGVTDALTRSGILVDDSAGHVRSVTSVEGAYSDVDALIVRVQPAPNPIPLPILVVPHR